MREEWEDAFIEALRRSGQQDRSARAAEVSPDAIRYHKRADPHFRQRVNSLRAVRTVPRSRIGLFIALLLAVTAPLCATITSAPVNLGDAGLTLTVGLRHWQEDAPDTWAVASTVGVTVNDLGGGLYTVSGLPAATGTDRYALTLSASGRGLVTYTYGAQPGQRVVWREELALPSVPYVFKAGDTAGSISLVVLRRLPAAACEPETTATFTAATQQTNVAIITDEAAVISDCELDATTGTYGLTLTYDWQDGDLDTVGKYLGEFELCYSPTSCQTLPSDNRLTFTVVRRLGG